MVAERIHGKSAQLNYDVIPSIIYTHPRLPQWVRPSRSLRLRVLTKSRDFSFRCNWSGARIWRDQGMVKILSDADSDQILGAHVVGPSAADLVQQIVIAIEMAASTEDLQLMVFGHPTMSEAVHEAALAVDGRAIHMVNRPKR